MKLYSTAQVSAHSGATLRQLQWWDEQKLLRPKRIPGPSHTGYQRMYTEAQLRAAWLIVKLRGIDVGLESIRSLMGPIECVVAGSMWVVRNGRKVGLTQNEKLVRHLAEQIGAVEKLEVEP